MPRSVLCALLGSALLSITFTLHGCGGGKKDCPAAGKIVPCILRNFYKLPSIATADSKEALFSEKTTQAVYASLNQHWSSSDRAAFQNKFGLPDRNVTEMDLHHMESDSRCEAIPDDCGEANLDVQYMLAMSPWSHMGFYYTDDDFTAWIEKVSNLKSPPDVFSISYGEVECGVNSDLMEVFNSFALKLGTRGVTIVASSGDDGAQSSLAREGCTAYEGNDGCKPFEVNWPASSPYVTGVGATMGVESGSEEVACQISCQSPPEQNKCSQKENSAMITSGGGYSAYDKPDYQNNVVSGTKRGVPDVSLAGHAYEIYLGGQIGFEDGTSASAPAFAGIVSQVNARRIAENKPTVGFINPVIYKTPSAFNDITSGANKCGACDTAGICMCCGGYDATAGWDAVTGLGSVDFQKFEALFEPSSVGKEVEPMISKKQVRNATASIPSLLRSVPHHIGWKKMDRAAPDMLHKVLFAVKQQNLNRLEEILLDRSNPQSPDYGKWLSGDEVRQLTFNEKAVQTVTQSLVEAGATTLSTSLGGEFVSALAPIHFWEQFLQCEFHLHERSGRKGIYIAADSYSLPSDLQGHLQGALRVLEISPVVDHAAKAIARPDVVPLVV